MSGFAQHQMTRHTLEAPKGWPSPHAVDFRAKLSANVTIDPVRAGRVVHLNSVGEYEMGLPDVVNAGHMPIFLFQNSNDPDVANVDPAAGEAGEWIAIAPVGYLMGLVAAGAYELESTEFDTSLSYAPGDTLTATPSNTDATTGGRITKGTAYSKPLCGVVSRGKFENSHRRQALAFWPVWLPRQA